MGKERRSTREIESFNDVLTIETKYISNRKKSMSGTDQPMAQESVYSKHF